MTWLNMIQRRFEEIRVRYVLYRGGGMETEAGVNYQNVENYLKMLSEGVFVANVKSASRLSKYES